MSDGSPSGANADGGATSERARLAEDIVALIDRLAGGAQGDAPRDDAARDALLSRVRAWQRERVPAVARLGERAVPTDVFRFTRVAAHPPSEDVRVFLTSGTTSGARGAHAVRDLTLYDRAARHGGRRALFSDVDRMRLVVLAPHPDEVPESSLSYMLGRFEAWFGSRVAWVWRAGALDVGAYELALDEAIAADEPVALLGTSFAFVHAEDALTRNRRLPEGSRLMQTGGYKGRSREVEPAALRRALSARYGLAEPRIVAEYGMTELSSQLYEGTLRAHLAGVAGPRRYEVPGWVRATVVDPETLAPVAAGRPGLLRIDDLANLDGSCAIQTSDLAAQHEDGLEILGRAQGAVPRGCSLAIEEALDER